MTNRPLVRVGDITFDLDGQRTQPDIEVSGGTRTVEKELIGGPVATQVMGPAQKSITIVGECSRETANAVDDLDEVDEALSVRSDRFAGTAIPESTNTSPLKKQRQGTDVYRFRIELTEVRELNEVIQEITEFFGLL
jgi:hypothetical protein